MKRKQKSSLQVSRLQILRMTYSALYLAIAMVLPFITGQIPEVGTMLSPMHIPVLLCGFMCGWPWGLAVGFIAPPLRSAVFGMPPMFPQAAAMAFELAVYGSMSGWLYRMLPKKPGFVYVVLILSMIAGRIVWGAMRFLLAGLSGTPFTWELFVSGAVLEAVPGIIMHLILIPALVIAMNRAGLSLNRGVPVKGPGAARLSGQRPGSSRRKSFRS